MAIRHGLAGKYGKSEAHKRAQRALSLLIGFALLGGLATGFVFGFAFLRWSIVPMLFGCLGLGVIWGVWIWTWPKIELAADERAKDRIRYMRGGEAEGLVASILERELDKDWHVFNGLKLEAESDVDHVVVGPGGLFCVSTKSHRGVFAGTADGLLHNGKPSAFAQQALGMTMAVRGRLAALMGGDVPYVRAVLAVPFGYTEGDAAGGKVWLVHQDDLADRLAPENGPKQLTKDRVERIVKALEMLEGGAAAVYRRPQPATVAGA